MRRARPDAATAVLVTLAIGGAAFFVLPLFALIVRAPWSTAIGELSAPGVAGALRLSLVCSIAAAALSALLGVPLAWVYARVPFPGKTVVRALTTLPMVLPPVVGGIALLVAFGRRGVFGEALDAVGVRLPFTTAAVIVAETFVAMPFLVISVEAAFRSMDRRYEDAARTLGASRGHVLRTVTLPLVAPALGAGLVLAWARALGEFGATITFAGNFPGTTQTMPLAAYLALETNIDTAVLLGLALLAVSLVVLIALRDRFLSLA
ncbi:MAG TPA: ABC transporter permease [Candidatus Acidoferrales bacterium]|nr:ABC transporter permease [Candidatus Acidoferrales bacterium]